jgi:hypothetical protein
MALELIGSLLVAAVFGLMAWAFRRWVPSAPKWLISVSAGVGLIGTTVWLEYDWFNRVSAALPPGFVVVNDEATSNPLRPWTYLVPITTSFSALDTNKLARHPQVDTLVTAPVFGFARWKNPQSALIVFDCADNRQTPIVDGMQIDEAGVVTGAAWVTPEAGDELHEAACLKG